MQISHSIGGLLCSALLASAVSISALAATDARRVNGLIVQLREAPSHAVLMRERALGTSAGTRTHEREHARWQDVVRAMPALRISERRAVGESAQLMRFEKPMTVSEAEAAAAQLSQRPDVLWAAANTRERRLQATPPAGGPPSDPRYSEQWWLQLPGTGSNGVPNYLTAWTTATSATTGDPNSLVAVLDNGIVAHPDLAGKVVNGYDMVSDPVFSNDRDGRDADASDPGDWVDADDLQIQDYKDFKCQVEPSSWHGTAIAGMLAATVNNGQGGASMNWPGRVLAVRVAAKCGADVADIVDGIRWVAGLSVCLRSDAGGNCLEAANELPAPRARVINISFGGDGECSPQYQPAIDAARARGVVVVAAAGNENAALPTRPAKCRGVIGVAALNRDGFKSTYSNFGSMLAVATVGGDNHVPGDDRWAGVADSGLLAVGNNGSTVPTTEAHFNYFGTSFSTPVVAGAVSLMLAVNPALSAAQIEQGLRASARPHVTSSLLGVAECSNANPGRCLCTASTCGAGILDVPQALAYANALRLGNPYTPPQWPVVSIDTAQLRDAAAAGPDRPSNAPTPPPSGGDSSGGGGAMSAWWLLALGAAVWALRRRVAAL